MLPERQTNLPANVSVIRANLFPESICPYESAPWLYKTYTDKKPAYVTDIFCPKDQTIGLFHRSTIPRKRISARKIFSLAIKNISNGFAVCRQPLLPRASSNGERVCVLDFDTVFM